MDYCICEIPIFLEHHCGKCHKDVAFCPKCEGVLGPEFDGLTCGCCGYGRHNWDEFHELQSFLNQPITKGESSQ